MDSREIPVDPASLDGLAADEPHPLKNKWTCGPCQDGNHDDCDQWALWSGHCLCQTHWHVRLS